MAASDKKIKVQIVDDSAFMRKIIGDLLSQEPSIDVVVRSRNGEEAMKHFDKHSPDVVTLDIEMPGKNGLEVLKEIMAKKPTPVIMVSSLTQRGADVTMQALGLGAVDFVAKPSGTISLDMEKVAIELRKKVIAASRADLRNAKADTGVLSGGSRGLVTADVPPRRDILRHPELLIIGASTGGPNALQEVIPALPASFPLPILIVQHMPPGFTTSFAARLNERSKLHVLEGVDEMPIRRGTAIVAPGGYHLLVERRLTGLVCKLSETPPVRSVRPAADVLFSSVAEVVGGNVVALILTGMGKDGLDGARMLRFKGAYVIAESKETCVIYGMPGAIVEAGLADEVLPLYSIASALERVAKTK